MTKIILGLGLGGMLLLLPGCAAIPLLPSLLGSDPPASLLSTTQVEQAQRNYRIVKTNAVGQSTGFKLLGILSFKSASYFKATSKLYADAGVTEGRAQALANIVHEKTSTFFILFSLPKVTIRADLIEFLEPPSTAPAPPPPPPPNP